MKKLETRQIIVLAVAVIAALYGAYEFLVAGPALKKAKTACVKQTAHFTNYIFFNVSLLPLLRTRCHHSL